MTDFKFTGDGSGLDNAFMPIEKITAILNAFLSEFRSADSSEVHILRGCKEIDWYDPKRDSIGPRTFHVIVVDNNGKQSYAFQEV